MLAHRFYTYNVSVWIVIDLREMRKCERQMERREKREIENINHRQLITSSPCCEKSIINKTISLMFFLAVSYGNHSFMTYFLQLNHTLQHAFSIQHDRNTISIVEIRMPAGRSRPMHSNKKNTTWHTLPRCVALSGRRYIIVRISLPIRQLA